MQIVRHFPHHFGKSTLFLPKSRSTPESVDVITGLPQSLHFLPWRLVKQFASARMDRQFSYDVSQADPRRTIAYFWPSPSPRLLATTNNTSVVSVREMINSFTGTAKVILDNAFQRAGLQPSHTITDESVIAERAELNTYDFVFSSNSEVDASLIAAGLAPSRILKTSFGWVESRFNQLENVVKFDKFTAIFVGTIGIRKGALELLQAWARAKIDGQLYIIGDVESHFRPILEKFSAIASIHVLPFTNEIERLYKASHVFVFPTYEEGGPQVTYEAAGCGLPSITTPMGVGRIIEHERNGLVVSPGDVEALAEALTRLSSDRPLLVELAERVKADSLRFTYDIVAQERASLLQRARKS